jgi:hypothetical protein
MPYDPYINGAYQHINEQLGFPHQTSGHRTKQNLPRRDILSDAEERRQAAEREARARNLRGNTRIPPDAYPQVRKQSPQQEDALEEEAYEDEELSTRAPRSAVRYQPIDSYLSGVMGANIKRGSPPQPPNRHAIPARRSANQQEHTPQRGRIDATMRHENEMDIEEIAEPRTRRWFKPQWLIFVGLAILLMIAGFVAFSDLGSWWQTHTDDSDFGNPRTFQIDAVVGHGDSNSNPSHFIALNLKGEIVVLEMPGGNVKKAISYPITTLPGNQGNPPVRLVFQDFDHDGRIDLLVQIGDPPTTITYMLFNNGTQFVGKS